MTSTTKGFVFTGGIVAIVLAGLWAWSTWYDVPLRVPPHGDRGCWALLFGGKDFHPPVARLKGPTFIERFENQPVVTPELRAVGGEAFLRTVQSIIVGPQAELIAYRQVRFDNPGLTLGPGDQVPDVSEIGFHERMNSLKVQCK